MKFSQIFAFYALPMRFIANFVTEFARNLGWAIA